MKISYGITTHNEHEEIRKLLEFLVKHRDDGDEIVIDAFAGIGYYSLPMLVRSNVKHLHACEINPNSIEALSWGAKKNNVSHKLTIHEGDNKIALGIILYSC